MSSERPGVGSDSSLFTTGQLNTNAEYYGVSLKTVFFIWLTLHAASSFADGTTAQQDISPGSTIAAPYVDSYGQKIAAAWPGKVSSDNDLMTSASVEQARLKLWAVPSDRYDSYGGACGVGWHAAGSGFFRVVQHDKVWWLVTPDGNPCFYKGLDTAPAEQWETTPVSGRESIFQNLPDKSGQFADAWRGDAWGDDPGISSFAFCTANLIRKYGADWKNQFRTITLLRLKAWGFSGFGKWCDVVPGVPYIPVLNRTGVPLAQGGRHPDPFDPATAAALKSVLALQITPSISDPTIVAWSFGNEYDEMVSGDEIRGILLDSPDVAAKKALVDYALAKIYDGSIAKMASSWNLAGAADPTVDDLYRLYASNVPDDDVETLRRYYTDRYYALIAETIKSIDPNHLYAGSWTVPAYWANSSDWWLTARYCDIVGFDNYGFDFAARDFDRLIRQVGKPVLCGEFAFPQSETDRGFSDFGALSLESPTESGRAYERYLSEAERNPFCVGVCWFQYRDQPITGRGPGHGDQLVYGENYSFGLVDITDNPKWNLVALVRGANLMSETVRSQLKP